MCEMNVFLYITYQYLTEAVLCVSSNGRETDEATMTHRHPWMLPKGISQTSERRKDQKTKTVCDKQKPSSDEDAQRVRML